MIAIIASILLTIAIGLLGPSAMVPDLGGPAWLPPFSLDVRPDPHLVIGMAVAAIVLGGLGLFTGLTATRHVSRRPSAVPAHVQSAPHAAANASHPATGGANDVESAVTDRTTAGSPPGHRTGIGEHAEGTAPDHITEDSNHAEKSTSGPAATAHRSSRDGLSAAARLLVVVGCIAAGLLALLPPSGSGDHLNYAAYGRMVVLGVNPYTHGAVDLPGDPIARAVEEPWREEPSVYGPVATGAQALASWVGGDSLRLTMFVLAVLNSAAFVGTGLLIDRSTRRDPGRRLRAALLWTANPLLLYQLVAGMHVDTLAVACMIAALLARGRPLRAGALLGLGVAIKVNAGLVALGPAWELRRRPGRLALMAGAALAVVIAGYAVVGTDAIEPVTRTSKAISHASYWKLVQGWLQTLVGPGSAYRGEIQIGSLLVLVLVAWSLFRLSHRLNPAGTPPAGPVRPQRTRARSLIPPSPSPSSSAVAASPSSSPLSSSSLSHAPSAGQAAGLPAEVVAAVLVSAYVFATPYILPWYDGMAFALLALVAATAFDGFLVAHLLALSLAYLPARVIVLPDDLGWLRDVVRPQIVPWVLLALTAALVWWAWRAARPVRTRPAPAGRPS
ncbi:polyprenol phosphomannose-dependent alpha 1,6 mannosyltransferase MptB [Nonomuraea rhodomycinica]|uniref:Polyprenol phosphomannose-dependent alpha 1,6 mannosyltransferase MptB n=1 Tax=Nonomuraea rhodomycinica TaxID=1712872 RepID=A0A7Y6IU98_9ACTN|nr:polyprenol phosphomannose-dependent alpha 1,6 mannosyltransferase MptB [Nonomuraea rhodomycinica]NUW44365.1 polyprenol phosphomannose-dependent alpha 1,6 mannosyltransferase MptB [Nonomuraea rhodomycinica]